LRAIAISLYKNIIDKFRDTEDWLEDINCNIGVKQGCPLSLTPFNIYTNKLENCLEEIGCVNVSLARIAIILLLHVEDIIVMEMSPYDLNKQLKILEDFFL